MKENMIIDMKNYDAMYQTVKAELLKKYPYSKTLFISISKEDYAEYIALSYCRKLHELTAEENEMCE